MNYYIDLFSPETAKAFSNSSKEISGFRISRKTYVENQEIGKGDHFICYCTKIQRLIGVLEVTSKYFVDDSPIFSETEDPFVLRFKVTPSAERSSVLIETGHLILALAKWRLSICYPPKLYAWMLILK